MMMMIMVMCHSISFLKNTRSLTHNIYLYIKSLSIIYSWEQWILRVVVNNTPRPMSDNSAAVIERQRLQDTAEGMLRAVLLQIFDIAGGDIQHIPPVMYEFEISSSGSSMNGSANNNTNSSNKNNNGKNNNHKNNNNKRVVDERENVYSRVANMPSLINLGN
jgi:Autophagy-related protein 101